MIKKIFIKDKKIKASAHIILISLPILISIFALAIGRMPLSIGQIIKFFNAYLGGREFDPMLESVIINVRLPRIITGLVVGAGLSAAGLSFQGVFSNPLATPDILGVSSASSLGAVIGILLSFSNLSIQALALVFGLIGVVLTLYIGKTRTKSSTIMLILAGLVVSSLSNALASLLKYTADPTDKLPAISYWLMGSFARSSYKNLILSAPLIIFGIILIRLLIFKLNIMSLSEDEAKSLGVNVKKTRLIFIFASTLITASSISMCGQVGWVGLIIPHMARMMVGANNTHTLPISLSLGASLMVLIEALSRTVSVIELPISVLTAIIGAPIFISLIRKTGGGFN
ncbi:iron ABC transporter permease [uncultured Parvimonas sp.]|uniref:FecCD family ABC transporter permease n=1 Tax=uncultured Parvimonas sp. TaxID=747372 RepID=UPI00280643E8|nr:iron ABC transporter permease [uncultured Parvimonas sp.]